MVEEEQPQYNLSRYLVAQLLCHFKKQDQKFLVRPLLECVGLLGKLEKLLLPCVRDCELKTWIMHQELCLQNVPAIDSQPEISIAQRTRILRNIYMVINKYIETYQVVQRKQRKERVTEEEDEDVVDLYYYSEQLRCCGIECTSAIATISLDTLAVICRNKKEVTFDALRKWFKTQFQLSHIDEPRAKIDLFLKALNLRNTATWSKVIHQVCLSILSPLYIRELPPALPSYLSEKTIQNYFEVLKENYDESCYASMCCASEQLALTFLLQNIKGNRHLFDHLPKVEGYSILERGLSQLAYHECRTEFRTTLRDEDVRNFPFMFDLNVLPSQFLPTWWPSLKTVRRNLSSLLGSEKLYDALDLSPDSHVILTDSLLMASCNVLPKEDIDIPRASSKENCYPIAHTSFHFKQKKNKSSQLLNLLKCLRVLRTTEMRLVPLENSEVWSKKNIPSTCFKFSTHENDRYKFENVIVRLRPGTDIDLLVDVSTEAEFDRIVKAQLERLQRLVSPHYQLCIEPLPPLAAAEAAADTKRVRRRCWLWDPLFEYRTVQMYIAPKWTVFMHHFAPVRGFVMGNGKERKWYLSASCILSLLRGEIGNCARFQGQKNPLHTMYWFKFRGFSVADVCESGGIMSFMKYFYNPWVQRVEKENKLSRTLLQMKLFPLGFDIRQLFPLTQKHKDKKQQQQQQQRQQRPNKLQLIKAMLRLCRLQGRLKFLEENLSRNLSYAKQPVQNCCQIHKI